jgi:hypothetical protein
MSDLLDLVLEAHGGLERWREVESIDLRLTMGGPFAAVKQQPHGLPDVLVRVSAHTPRTRISPFPYSGSRGIFQPGKAWIENTQGDVTSQLEPPRDSFQGHELLTPWSDLQFLYFVGYAFRTYFTMPFVLIENGVKVQEEALHQENDESWRVLKVIFPPGMDVHCPVQKFYFDERGYLVRNDYFTEVSPGTAAHYIYDHKNFDGFIFPTHRRVVMREGDRAFVSRSSIFILDIHDVFVNRGR